MGRIENATRNIFFGTIGNIVTMLLGFISRTIFIHILGITYLGINGLYTNILTVLSLAELGIGFAMNYTLFKPVADKNYELIKSLMQLYKRLYQLIAVAITIFGFLLLPFLKYMIKNQENFNMKELSLYYLVFLFNTVITYFVSYKYSLINAEQKNYILTNIQIITSLITMMFQIIILVIYKNFMLYLLTAAVIGLIQKIFINIYLNRLYPYLLDKNYTPLSKEEKEPIKKNIIALVYHKIGHMSINQTDNIVIASFLNVTIVGLLLNYNLIIISAFGFINVIFNSVAYSLGNLIATDSKDRQYQLFKVYRFLAFWLYGFVFIALVIFITPFITLWIGSDMVVDYKVIFLILLDNYFKGHRIVVDNFKTAAGIFEADKYISIIQGVFNLVITILLVRLIGLEGVFLGKLLSGVISNVTKPFIVYKIIFDKRAGAYFRDAILYIMVISLAFSSLLFIKKLLFVNITVINFIVMFILVMIIPNIIFYLFFHRSEEFQYVFNIINSNRSREAVNHILNKLKNINIVKIYMWLFELCKRKYELCKRKYELVPKKMSNFIKEKSHYDYESENNNDNITDNHLDIIKDIANEKSSNIASENASNIASENARENARENVRENARDNARDNAISIARDNAIDIAKDNARDIARDNARDIAKDNASENTSNNTRKNPSDITKDNTKVNKDALINVFNEIRQNTRNQLSTYPISNVKQFTNVYIKNFINDRKKANIDRFFWPNGLLAISLEWSHFISKDIQDFYSLIVYYDKWIQTDTLIQNLDHVINGYSLIYVYQLTKANKYKQAIKKITNYLFSYPKDINGSLPYRNNSPNDIYIESIGMICPFLCRYGKLFKDQSATQLAINQIANFIQNGFDGNTFLPYHGYNIKENIKLGIIGWGRAVGWLLIGMVDSLEYIDPSHPQYDYLCKSLNRIVNITVKYQMKDGHYAWQLTALEGHIDTSATSMISYAIKRGVILGILNKAYLYNSNLGLLSLQGSIMKGVVTNSSPECIGFSMYPQDYGAFPWSQGPTTALTALFLEEELKTSNGINLIRGRY